MFDYLLKHNLDQCHVHEEKKVCFVPIPKNASRSTVQWSKMNDFVLSSKRKDLSEYFVFAILRDPETRFYSGLYTNWRIFFQHLSYSEYLDEYCKQYEITKNPYVDEHLATQSYFLKDSYGEDRTINVFLKFENYSSDLCGKVCTPCQFKHINVWDNVSRKEDLDNFKRKEVFELVKHHYEEDYELIRSVFKN